MYRKKCFQRIDGKDLKKFSLFHLRTQMALVGQEPRLFSGTIKENICFGLNCEVSSEKIMLALELANARKVIDSLPLVSRRTLNSVQSFSICLN